MSAASWESVRLGTLEHAVVGASEVAALWNDPSAFMTRRQLYQVKRGERPRTEETDRMRWGKRHEASINVGVSEDWGIPVQDWSTVTLDQLDLPRGVRAVETDRGLVLLHECGLAISPDALCNPGVILTMERKCVDGVWFARWGNKLPATYRIQAMAQAGGVGLDGTLVPVLVNGNDLQRFDVEFRQDVFDGICDEVYRFLREVREGIEPEPSTADDYADVRREWSGRAAEGEECRDGDAELRALAEESARLGREEKAAKERKAEVDARIVQAFGSARVIRVDGWKLAAVDRSGTPDRQITTADVGQIIKGRAGSRSLTITAPKGAKEV